MYCTWARSVGPEEQRVTLEDLAVAQRAGEERARRLVDDRADEIGGVRRSGRWSGRTCATITNRERSAVDRAPAAGGRRS